MLRSCPAHGPFEGPRCPRCEDEGAPLLDPDRRVRLSKFLSGALRHFPDDVGIELSPEGWAELEALVSAARERYPWADREEVLAVLRLDPKGRFELEDPEGRVRAAYGHSVDVDLPEEADPRPSVLYHGTAPSNLPSIRASGLRPMGRQEVHLSPDEETAREVGRRHAEDPVLLEVDAEEVRSAGIEIHRRAPTVYTCEHVPARFLSLVEGPDG